MGEKRERPYGYTIKERNLLLNSFHVQQDYPSFYKILKKYKNSPTLSQAEKEADGELALLLSREDRTLSDIIDAAKMEWDLLIHGYVPVCRDDPKLLESCELCGHPHLRYQYSIVNRFNKNQMVIGSECVLEYELDGRWKNVEIKTNFDAQIRELNKMNKATAEMNVLTQNGIIRINAAVRAWNNLPYLPSPKTAKEIVDIVVTVPAMLNQVKTAKLPHSKAEVKRCKTKADLLESLMDRARHEVAEDTSGWRVSNVVYRWVVERDQKNNGNKLLPMLLKDCRITSENVANIMEEGHRQECINRLTKVMPNNIRLKFASEDPNRIKVYLKEMYVEYPFWVFYGPFIQCAVKHGFPEAEKLTPITGSDFISMGAAFDRYDGVAGSNYLKNLIQRAGGSIQDENEREDHYLIRLNQNGVILDVDILALYLSNAILSGNQGQIQNKLREQLRKQAPYKIVKQNWDAIYGHKYR